MEYMLFVIDLIGTVAFAFSGAMTAIRKEMDMLGVMILGMVTAVGGGIIRDIILGITPPQAFMEPVFALGAVLISVFVFAVFYFRGQRRKKKCQPKEKGHHPISGQQFQEILMLADTLGLGHLRWQGSGLPLTMAWGLIISFRYSLEQSQGSGAVCSGI